VWQLVSSGAVINPKLVLQLIDAATYHTGSTGKSDQKDALMPAFHVRQVCRIEVQQMHFHQMHSTSQPSASHCQQRW